MSANGTENYGIVIAGHGSRDPEGVREFESLVQLIKTRANGHPVTHGFLEFARPTIDEAVRENIDRGMRRVAIVPGVLLAAAHAKNDLPNEVQLLRREFPSHELHFGAPINLHPAMLQICRDRIIEAEGASTHVIKRSDSCLVVVGRGTTDPDANSEVSKLARILEEGMGFGASFVCYSGTARPLVADGLRLAARLGFARLVVLPFMLFTGILMKRIYAATDELAAKVPGLDVVKCDYLGLHQRVADLFLERAAEAVAGNAAMNCSLCKYRVQMVGYESEIGAPQVGHHFKVRGIGMGPAPATTQPARSGKYVRHPIEARSLEIIETLRDWSAYPPLARAVLQRLVHTTGDAGAVDEVFISRGALESGLAALKKGCTVITDVTMVQSGLRRPLLEQLGIATFCGVHDDETRILAEASGLTRSAAGIRRAWEQFGNHVVVAIGDAPTAIEESLRLVREQQWRPHLVVGLPVGFVGTREAKESLRTCLRVPRVTNSGTRGGSPWAATVVNALLIEAVGVEPEQNHGTV